jgi:hypothetical protein
MESPVSAQTLRIEDDFEGCEFGRLYPLSNGQILECRQFRYRYSYRPRVQIVDRQNVLINDQPYRAVIHNGNVVSTNVSDEFEGCDYDRIIIFDNGYGLRCSEYKYRYAYRPRVVILLVNGRDPQITIDGDAFAGRLVRMR